MIPCTSFEEVRSRAMAEVRVEEDQAPMPETKETRRDKPDHREHPSKNGDSMNHHYPQREQVNYASNNAEGSQKSRQATYPPLSSYNFCVDEAGMVDSLHALGGSLRWPKKSDRPDEQKDKSKWCGYHNDHEHRIEDCNHLRKEVAWLLSKGYLNHLLDKKGKVPAGSQDRSKHIILVFTKVHL